MSPEPPGPFVFAKQFVGPSSLPGSDSRQISPNTQWTATLSGLPPGMQLGRVEDDLLITRNLPLHLANSARAWLEHLPKRVIHG